MFVMFDKSRDFVVSINTAITVWPSVTVAESNYTRISNTAAAPPFLYDDGVLPASVWLNEQLAPIRRSDLTVLRLQTFSLTSHSAFLP